MSNFYDKVEMQDWKLSLSSEWKILARNKSQVSMLSKLECFISIDLNQKQL